MTGTFLSTQIVGAPLNYYMVDWLPTVLHPSKMAPVDVLVLGLLHCVTVCFYPHNAAGPLSNLYLQGSVPNILYSARIKKCHHFLICLLVGWHGVFWKI